MFIGDAIDLAHRAITTAVKAGGVGLTTLGSLFFFFSRSVGVW